ncbi:Uncharacterized protein APZ42_034317 [Daphnia magna]|uniref:Uncharacterized protein n=2 Tax=Daphnia magna TaxID=35525 RepID=A0ABR0B386_9CRUS|nr:hypothetical protein OUZ56_028235 [Daphnia magna]KZS03058.1 Uncharacterized protein APZ42_034317 [Daphnia magna]
MLGGRIFLVHRYRASHNHCLRTSAFCPGDRFKVKGKTMELEKKHLSAASEHIEHRFQPHLLTVTMT